ncbi:MAG: laminin G domain-containing protein, partial [Nanoarchaeota archaeon]|nr:laminin G domain-containing protein [Nanoarchaeota archaeon]
MDAVKKIIFIFVFIFIFLQFMFFIFSQEILITDNSGTYKWSDGNLSNIQYNSSHISLFYDNSTSNLEFPDYRNENGWINMSKNVLLLHFNEISGAFEDFSGFGNNGSNSGGRYYYQGKLNKSVYFDSDGDQISIPNDASLKLNKFSISFWVKAQSSSSTYNNIVAKEVGNANRNYVVFVPTNGKISGSSSFGGTASTVSYNDSIFDKKWYHIVYQVNESNYQSIYVNGIFRSGLQKGSNLDYGNNNNLLIGNNLFSDDFNGYIDELAIWNMTFSDDEISLIYNTQKKDFELNGTFESPIFNIGENTSWLNLTYDNFPFGQKLPANAEVETSYSSGNINMTDNKLLLYFNESSGDIIDYSGNSNNGTRTGTTLEMEGVIDNSIYFDGASDYISIPTVLDYPNITFVAWVYPNGIKDEANTIFSTKGYDGCTISTSRYGFNFYLETWNNFDGRINVDLGNTATGCSGLNTAKGVIENHKWNHVAFSYNEETDVLKIYKDGV